MGLKINCRNIFKGLQNDDNTFHKLCTNLQCYQLMYKCTSFTPVSLALGIMFAYLIGFKSTFYCFNLQIFNYQRAYSLSDIYFLLGFLKKLIIYSCFMSIYYWYLDVIKTLNMQLYLKEYLLFNVRCIFFYLLLVFYVA